MFYNTGIGTYVWILSNKKDKKRKGKVQLINGANLCGKMKKSLGSKRNEMSDEDISIITKCFGSFEVVDARELDKPAEQKSNRGRQSSIPKNDVAKTFASKIFQTHDFGYRRITVERSLRESFQFSDGRIEELRFIPNALLEPMKWIYADYGQNWSDKPDCKQYGILTEHKDAIRKRIKSHFGELKEAQVKDLFDRKIWLQQRTIMAKAKQIQKIVGSDQHDDMNKYEDLVQATGVNLEAIEKKQIIRAVSWRNQNAEKVIKKIHSGKANPIYGLFNVNGSVVEFKVDGELRDFENIPIYPTMSVQKTVEEFFKKEVIPHVSDAWIDSNIKDKKDNEIGIVGYEIPFNKHFYEYQPPRDLTDIDTDLNKVSTEILDLLQEVRI